MVRILACEVMKEELLALPRNEGLLLEFVPMALHRYPERLRQELQSRLDNTGSGISGVVLAFGLCGGAAAGLRAPGVPLVVPRVHDCIPFLLGSVDRYQRELEKEKGTFFLSGGWMEGERTIFSEYRRTCERFGQEKATRYLAAMFDSYRRFLFINTGHPREELHLSEAERFSCFLGVEFGKRRGSPDWYRRILNGPWGEEHFVVVPPNGEVHQELFGEGGGSSPSGRI